MNRWMCVCSICIIFVNVSYPQMDSTFSSDSIVSDLKIESIMEQSNDVDDSPLLDFIWRENPPARSFIQVRSRFTESLEKSAGFSNGKYLGSALKSYQRLKFSTLDHLTGGILLEKDAGEKRLNDFVVGNVTLTNYGLISKLAIGDYFLEAGQGLALWRSYDIIKGSDILTPVQREASGLNPYLSSGEGQFLRGAAMELNFGRVIPILFFSRRDRSGTVDSSGVVRSFYDLGYFRTEEEIKKQNVFIEQQLGARVEYQTSQMNTLGATFYSIRYSRGIFIHTHDVTVTDQLTVASLDYTYGYKPVTVSGEIATSKKSIAGIGNCVISPLKKLDLIISARYYPARFVAVNGLGFGETRSNEQGFYFGVNLQPFAWSTLSSYFDQYKSIESTTMPFLSTGTDFLVNAECSINRRSNVVLRYHRKIGTIGRTQMNTKGLDTRVVEPQQKENLRLSVEYRLSSRTSLRGRIEYVMLRSNASGNKETGFLTYQDIVVRPLGTLSLNFRVVYCKTDSYASGVGEYERDLDGVMTQPILYGSMIRWYALVKYTLSDGIKISLKYIDSIRDNVKKIGTGLDQLPGNRDDRLGVQIDLNI